MIIPFKQKLEATWKVIIYSVPNESVFAFLCLHKIHRYSFEYSKTWNFPWNQAWHKLMMPTALERVEQSNLFRSIFYPVSFILNLRLQKARRFGWLLRYGARVYILLNWKAELNYLPTFNILSLHLKLNIAETRRSYNVFTSSGFLRFL